jgi:alpha-glucosidase (family GH31 glycosyl hydrolase)
VLDSPWETHYNTFVPNPERYPDFAGMVDELHAQEIRVVLWVTQMVNVLGRDFEPGGDEYVGPSPNFEEAEACGFFVNEAERYSWWKGSGAAIDFFNPRAVAWWHSQQDPLMAVGIDGWKLDFGEEYISTTPILTAGGEKTKQEYSEEYYRDFFAYGRHRRGNGFVTMVRPYDRSYGFPGRFFARPEHAPVAWVGDNRRDFVGLEDALDHLFRSAAAGYSTIGSDIGGYLNIDDESVLGPEIPFDTLVFARWTAVGALTPFMQLHGRANITPWTVPDHADETVALYRYWATLHHELVPFFHSLSEAALAGASVPLRPIGDEASWPGDYRYALGDALLVAPILDATGARDVALPGGARWLDWWKLDGDWLDGGQTLAGVAQPDRARIPLYLREGAILPMTISSDVTRIGSKAHAGHLTLLAVPGNATTSFPLTEADGSLTTIDAGPKKLALTRRALPVRARVRVEVPPSGVMLDGAALAQAMSLAELEAQPSGWFFDATTRALWLELEPGGAAAVSW